MFKSNNKGATAIEYGLLALLVGGAVAAYESAPAAGKKVDETICKAADYMSGNDGTGCGTVQRQKAKLAQEEAQCEASNGIFNAADESCKPRLTPAQQCAANGNYWVPVGGAANTCQPGPVPKTAPDWYTYNAKLCSATGGSTITGNHLTGAYSCKYGSTTVRLPGLNGAT